MGEFQESSSKLLSIRDSVESSNLEVEAGDEKFYEEIEAPKFVDFTVPHHHCPDDRYWFCLRVGCDQKHEEEMDSETIYKNFVLRVMAARSPNIRLRKALQRNASRSPSKCPLSAPPKCSKPRLSTMAIISSISKTEDGKKGVVRSLLKPKPTTPALKTKPVAAKYLTTPRNRTCRPNQSLFRSVRDPKPANIELAKSRVAAKALVFRSPRKTIKVKTSVELRIPISKLCEGMNKLEISSQRKRALGYSSKSCKSLSNTPSKREISSPKVHTPSKREISSPKVQGKSLSSQTSVKQEAKSGRSINKSKVKGKLEHCVPPKKLSGDHHTNTSKKNKSNHIKKQLSQKVVKGGEVREAAHEEPCISSEVATSTMNSDLAFLNVAKGEVNCVYLEENGKSRSKATDEQEMNSNDGNGIGSSESCGEFMNHLNSSNSSEEEKCKHEFTDAGDKENAEASNDKGNTSNSSEEQKHEHEIMYGDDKENVAASNENSMHNKNTKPNELKNFAMHGKCGRVKKEAAQAESKSLKEGLVVSGPVTKLKKPKPTNPKPFRLRTDERGVLKEANLERKTDPATPGNETAHLSPRGKLQGKRASRILQKNVIIDQMVPKGGGLQISKAAAPVTAESNKHQGTKQVSSHLERLDKFRKMKSPIQKRTLRPRGSLLTKEKNSFLVPGQKLDVIHEISPEVWKAGKPPGNTTPPVNDCVASRSSSCGKRAITVAKEPNFHSTHTPRSCSKALSR